MSRLTQRAVVSPEHLPLPLCHGGCDKISWLPEGKIFSNVQREKIISKFLKESILKRVFRSKQMRWEGSSYQNEDLSDNFPGTRKKAESEGAPVKPFAPQAEGPGPRSSSTFGDDADDDTWACGAMGILRKQRCKMGRRNGENNGTTPRASSISQENLCHWNLDSEIPAPENKNLPPGKDSATGGSINKNSKQGMFQLWSYPLNEGSTMENRDFRKSSVETGFNVTNNPIRLFTLNHALVTSASVEKQVGSYPGLQIPSVLCWPYADGDFLKDRNEPYINLCSTIENNSGETLPALNWNLKYGNSSVEENLTDESDLSENEKASDSLLSYFKKMDLNLKPETIVNIEESVTEEPSEVFPYPDFLPSPFNTLDLHKLALSKSENWKVTVEPPESSVERLITRLLEMERLQHMTIQKERPRLQTTFCTLAATERPSSSKAIPKVRQPKLDSDPLSLQTTCVDKSREKRKSNSGSCKLEQNASKWNWSNAGKYKWNSRPTSLKSSSPTKQLVATCDDFRNLKSSILNPCQELATKPTPSQTTQSLVKMVSTRCLPPKSPIPVSSIPLSFPENQREEIKVPRTKKKLYQKNIALNRPFYIQKLNCLSPSFTAKDKCSPIDQK
ncbi:protein FAM217A isoform X4 [Panthera tigris]|uniref:protein FAM217A isoform X4 n=2 Tax=Panthera tigris TaxID=9694 RepID=UPI001C6FAC93|nr:protein FAM217A isoform X4 [Panthera tigris]